MKTNNITHKIYESTNYADLIIDIRLNDECKNGHEDFSITGTMHQKGKPKNDKYFLAGGCIHDEILKARPDLEIFVKLHLSDADGIPMHAISNMFYRLKNGFNNTPINSPSFVGEYCDYYRITLDDFNTISQAQSETHFDILFRNTGIIKAWKQQAIEGIQLLEQLTGKEFQSTATRSNLILKQPEVIEQETERINNGYYSPAAIQQRKQKQTEEYILQMTKDALMKCADIMAELSIKESLYRMGGERFVNNVIFYSHSREIKFNWKSEVLTPEEIQLIKQSIKLPEGVTFKN